MTVVVSRQEAAGSAVQKNICKRDQRRDRLYQKSVIIWGRIVYAGGGIGLLDDFALRRKSFEIRVETEYRY